jgi:hypothetical protein
MAIDENRCPKCGAERPANAPEGHCPSCLSSLARNNDTPGQVEFDATTVPAATSSGDEPETSPGEFEATGAHIPGPAAGAASSRTDATGDWTTGSDDPTCIAPIAVSDPTSPTPRRGRGGPSGRADRLACGIARGQRLRSLQARR